MEDAAATGWRGNGADWVRRARAWLDTRPAPAELRRFAPAVDAWQLLRPGVAALAPLRRPNSMMPRDAQHVVLVRTPAPPTEEQLDVWIGCLAYVLRLRPRAGGDLANQIRPPAGALARALRDECWCGTANERLRGSTLALLAFADRSADASLVRAVGDWLRDRRVALPVALDQWFTEALATILMAAG